MLFNAAIERGKFMLTMTENITPHAEMNEQYGKYVAFIRMRAMQRLRRHRLLGKRSTHSIFDNARREVGNLRRLFGARTTRRNDEPCNKQRIQARVRFRNVCARRYHFKRSARRRMRKSPDAFHPLCGNGHVPRARVGTTPFGTRHPNRGAQHNEHL